MTREDEILKRIEQTVSEDGYVRKNIYTRQQFGMGNNTSYFQVLVDRKLEGREYPTAQEVWEEMKMQFNFMNSVAAKASDEYLKIQNRVRDLEEHIKWLERRDEKK
jgi:hypothetical protein